MLGFSTRCFWFSAHFLPTDFKVFSLASICFPKPVSILHFPWSLPPLVLSPPLFHKCPSTALPLTQSLFCPPSPSTSTPSLLCHPVLLHLIFHFLPLSSCSPFIHTCHHSTPTPLLNNSLSIYIPIPPQLTSTASHFLHSVYSSSLEASPLQPLLHHLLSFTLKDKALSFALFINICFPLLFYSAIKTIINTSFL